MAFGWIIDRACVLWRPGCGRPGSCLLYQNAALSHYMLAAGLAYKVRPLCKWVSGYGTAWHSLT